MSRVVTAMRMRLDPQPGEVLDRSRPFWFSWNGSAYPAYPGDTIVSALAAGGERIFSRSLKYHRPRGLLTASFWDPGCHVQVGDEPNVRGAHRRVEPGMVVGPQNAWPSLRADVKSLNRVVGRFLTAGFYYKTFIKPQRLWPAYEHVLKRFAVGGRVRPDAAHAPVDKRYAHPDVLVAGGGPAGMAAAVAAARAGARVLLVEEEHDLGGHLRWGGAQDRAVRDELTGEVAATPGIEVLTDAVVAGRYDDNWVGVVERGLPHGGERLVKARAKALVVAAGLIERPYVFAGNDTPGVILSTAARRLINLHAVKPGHRAVVLTANAEGDAAVADLERAGVDVARVLDARDGGDIVRVLGGRTVRGVECGDGRRVACDLVVTAVGWTAPTSLLNMAGDKPVYDTAAARFFPDPSRLPDDVLVTGGLAGDGTIEELVGHGRAVGAEAARRAERIGRHLRAGVPTVSGNGAAAGDGGPVTVPALRRDPHPEIFRGRTHGIVDYSEDVTSKDIVAAAREGYDSVELVKRYTTVTMGPAQGKLETVNAVAVLSEATGRTITETGTTVWRPPYAPVTLGALAGRPLDPVRVSPMQPWHEARGAKPLVAGAWIRPDHYGEPAAEVRNVRARVGIIDVTPIGKLDLRGPDIPKLLNLLYVNKWSKLAEGRVRYGVMCAEDGVVLDDGVTGRLGPEHYLMSTTSSGAAAVWEWVENWLQAEHPDWRVRVTPVTTAYASINVAGPASRRLLNRLVSDVDLSPDAFGYMHVRTGRVAGVDGCVLWRIGFTGELSYELHVPAAYGLAVWEALLDAGADLGVQPFGVEAQRILRLEKGHFIVGQDTDGLTQAFAAGLDWAVKLDKPDFVGRPELVWAGQRDDHLRLVGLQPHDCAVVPAEASQIVDGATIVGRITSSRMSPTLDRSICLGYVAPHLSEPGTAVTVLLPDGRRVGARVMEHHAHVDPEGTRLRSEEGAGDRADAPWTPRAPVARSPIAPAPPAEFLRGWEVSTRRSDAELRLVDASALAKVVVRAPVDGAMAEALGVRFGRAARHDGRLVAGSGPGEWHVFAPPDTAGEVVDWLGELAGRRAADEFVTVVDLTSGRALVRVVGAAAADLLARLCPVDLSETVTPDGAALRSSVANVVTDLVRDDLDGTRSYLLHCERSSGQYLFDILLGAGAALRVDVDGNAPLVRDTTRSETAEGGQP